MRKQDLAVLNDAHKGFVFMPRRVLLYAYYAMLRQRLNEYYNLSLPLLNNGNNLIGKK